MSTVKVYIRHGGYFEEETRYVGGDRVLVHLAMTEVTYANLLQEIRDQVGEESDFLLYYVSNADGGQDKVVLRSDMDLLRLIVEQMKKATVYVIRKDKGIARTPTTQGSRIFTSVNIEEPSSEAPYSEEERSKEDDEERDEDEEVAEDMAEEAMDAADRTDLFESLTKEFGAWIREPRRLHRIVGHRNIHSESQPTQDDDARADLEAIRDWLIPHVHLDTALPLGVLDPDYYTPVAGALREGGLFKRKLDVSVAVGLHQMENRQQYKVENSDKGRVGFKCRTEGCEYLMRAKNVGTMWHIRTYNGSHTCSVDLDGTTPRQYPANVLGAFYAKKLITDGVVLKSKEMVDEMRAEYGIKIDYSFALRARNIAIEMMYGGFVESYKRLPSYLYLLQQKNPGTVYSISTSPLDDRLCYMFLALGQSLHAFQNNLLRSVIVVDGAHLKGKNKGTLFVACTKDGNEQVFPLAIGFGPIEDDDSWSWFLTNLRNCLGHPQDLLIVSDGHISIGNAVRAVFPGAHHGLCWHHLAKNMVTFGKHAVSIFEAAAYSYSDSKFEEYMENLMGSGIYQRLCEIGMHRWSRNKCLVPRTSFMTSNAAETMNARLLWARRLPICAMIEAYMIIVDRWFEEHRNAAQRGTHEVTETTYQKMAVSSEWARHYRTRGTTIPHVYRVEGDNGTYLVDMHNATCDCREWEGDMVPCRHACAAISFAGGRATDYVSHYFKQSTLYE